MISLGFIRKYSFLSCRNEQRLFSHFFSASPSAWSAIHGHKFVSRDVLNGGGLALFWPLSFSFLSSDLNLFGENSWDDVVSSSFALTISSALRLFVPTRHSSFCNLILSSIMNLQQINISLMLRETNVNVQHFFKPIRLSKTTRTNVSDNMCDFKVIIQPCEKI